MPPTYGDRAEGGGTDGDVTGTLDVGCRADLIWCDRDPHAVPAEDLTGTATWATWRAGVQVYRSQRAPAAGAGQPISETPPPARS